MSDVVSVVPEDIITDTNRFAPLSHQGSPVSTEVVDHLGGGGGIEDSPEFDCCRAFAYVDYYEPILATQPPGIPGMYGKYRPVGCRVIGVRRRSYRRVGYATGCEPVCATQPTGHRCNCHLIESVWINVLRGLTSRCVPCFCGVTEIRRIYTRYPQPHLFCHRSCLCRVLYWLRILCRMRRLRHVTASLGVRPRHCLLRITQPTCSSTAGASSRGRYTTGSFPGGAV